MPKPTSQLQYQQQHVGNRAYHPNPLISPFFSF
jgi:hypothetical protein